MVKRRLLLVRIEISGFFFRYISIICLKWHKLAILLLIKMRWTSRWSVETQSKLLKVLTGQLSHFLIYVTSIWSPSVYTVCPKGLIHSTIRSFETFSNDYQAKIIAQNLHTPTESWKGYFHVTQLTLKTTLLNNLTKQLARPQWITTTALLYFKEHILFTLNNQYS